MLLEQHWRESCAPVVDSGNGDRHGNAGASGNDDEGANGFDLDADELECPACGRRFANGPTRCPGCGLRFA